jgi:type IV pilus assembly protein PilC
VPQFVVTVKDRQGKKRSVEEEAPDHSQLVDRLHREGYFVIEVKESGDGRLARARGEDKKSADHRRRSGAGVKLDRLVFFTRQLSTMIAAGIPIVKIIRSLAAEEKAYFGKLLFQVADDVEQGDTFSDALRKYPKVFNRLYTALVESGEESGKLDVIMDQLADYLESVSEVRMKVKSAMRYPIFIFSFIALIFLAFILFVIPRFADIYASFEAKLPAPTQAVLSFSALVRENLLIALLAVAVLIGLVRFIMRTESGAYALDKLKLRLPGIGPIIKKTVVSRLARTLGVLVHSGMPIVQALNIVRRAADNRVFERGIMETKRSVEEGQHLAEALQGTGIFPELLLQMVSTGEQSGSLDLMFTKVAEFYEKQVKAAVEGLVTLIEPMAIVIMGVAVGGLIIVMYLPIFRLGVIMR